jgi:hypothetical protein
LQPLARMEEAMQRIEAVKSRLFVA